MNPKTLKNITRRKILWRIEYEQKDWKVVSTEFDFIEPDKKKDYRKEKVVIKLNQDELVMTRFSNPKSIMRFSAKVPALVHIPTPLGTQHFLTDTSLFAHDPNGQTVDIHYQLKHPETEDVFADYELEVSWF